MPLPEPTDRPALDIRFSRRPEHVARARRATRLTLTSWGVPDEAVEAAVLVVSELVTNAVRHARSTPGRDIGLRITRREDHRVRVEVADAGDGLPSPRTAFPDDESHRGLPSSPRWPSAMASALARTASARRSGPTSTPHPPPRERTPERGRAGRAVATGHPGSGRMRFRTVSTVQWPAAPGRVDRYSATGSGAQEPVSMRPDARRLR